VSVCQCCGQTIRAPRVAKRGQTKALRDDLAKAQSACDVLERHVLQPEGYWLNKRDAVIEACMLELTRMRRALVEPRLLWSIYRRASKKPMEEVYGV
jgi:hypothetical protein